VVSTWRSLDHSCRATKARTACHSQLGERRRAMACGEETGDKIRDVRAGGGTLLFFLRKKLTPSRPRYWGRRRHDGWHGMPTIIFPQEILKVHHGLPLHSRRKVRLVLVGLLTDFVEGTPCPHAWGRWYKGWFTTGGWDWRPTPLRYMSILLLKAPSSHWRVGYRYPQTPIEHIKVRLWPRLGCLDGCLPSSLRSQTSTLHTWH